jgi:hypothetical protein
MISSMQPDSRMQLLHPTGAMRTWSNVGDFTREGALARIYDGVHYRNSTEVGTAMGRKIGELAVRTFPRMTR